MNEYYYKEEILLFSKAISKTLKLKGSKFEFYDDNIFTGAKLEIRNINKLRYLTYNNEYLCISNNSLKLISGKAFESLVVLETIPGGEICLLRANNGYLDENFNCSGFEDALKFHYLSYTNILVRRVGSTL
jgi:hypothetical protein